MNEKDLTELLALITGKGEYRLFGNGIHTHPGHDENQDKIHAACEELEKRGLIVRKINDPTHAFFVRA